MKKLLNTIYVTTPDSYLSLDGDNLVVLNNDTKIGRVPMHNIESIVTFGYTGASPALMRYCVEHNVSYIPGKVVTRSSKTLISLCFRLVTQETHN